VLVVDDPSKCMGATVLGPPPTPELPLPAPPVGDVAPASVSPIAVSGGAVLPWVGDEASLPSPVTLIEPLDAPELPLLPCVPPLSAPLAWGEPFPAEA